MAKKAAISVVQTIISTIHSEERQDIVILIIPSHDKHDKPLKDQDVWANAAMELFADLYTGATAFETFQGIYKDSDGKIYRDKPILIETYVKREALADVENLRKLVDFAKRMGRDARQKAVALIVNDVFHTIDDFSPSNK